MGQALWIYDKFVKSENGFYGVWGVTRKIYPQNHTLFSDLLWAGYTIKFRAGRKGRLAR